MNILIIDDDILLAEKIRLIFEKKIISNRIKILSNYQEFLRELVVIKSYDIILIDIILEKNWLKNGIDIVNIIRKEDKCIPLIIISWLDDICWLEKAFKKWASDYIIKPFRLKELELRIYKWFKIYFYSNKSNDCDFLMYEDLVYNLEENSFYYNDEKLNLTKWQKYLLWVFITNKERILSERFLIEKIWGDIWFVVERNLRIVILRLKKSLIPYWLDVWIKNIRWEWYIFEKKDYEV